MNESSLLDVFWTTQDDFPNYSTNFSVTWARLGDVRVDEAFTTDLQYTIAGLDAFTTYNVCVATCVSNGPNYPVCGVNTTTKESGRPVNVTAKAEGAEALWVGWEPPVEPNGVVISYTVIWTHAVTRHADTLDVDGNTTSVVISSLQPCTNYTITVSAATAAGSGQTGGPAKATTEIEATVQVSLIGLQSSTTYSVGVSASVLEIKGSSAVRVNGTTARAGEHNRLVWRILIPTPRSFS
ncbi:Receptor-type tyrosine-protein phosphatase S [Portunus trituberculatus]|uniref:Receptor-type tyrosine-protein phosphatase S n=1 Tax=Portunus trituberculatus TaxID=210409 RepID=A0A5B7IQ36_PORTR|nr:Receptor-type tyrosine-protein phosphatase S [Portunus trituberculatus]